ncbi:MAG: TrkH family potassium uptake protein [Dehalococcoidia bacterium]|nr:MAG: TrkH family potassium uptake protein [Dehalococcoidia bacterium]
MRIKVVLHYLGLLITGVGFSMFFPLGWSLYYNGPDSPAFAISIGISVGSGLLLWRLTPGGERRLSRREAIMLVAGAWILASAFGALPYELAGTFQSYLDAYFEAMSGFTTTGASVLASIESQPHGILLWRNLTQWLGGMGIITLFVALFPIFGIGAAHLVEAEMPGPQTERLTARIRDTVKSLWYLYIGFSALELILLWQAGGMPLFDALIVTFGTMPTGGFCLKSLSIGAYNSVIVEGIVIAFMTLAGVNFGLYYRLLWKRQPRRLFSNPEFRLYIALLTGASLFIALNLIRSMGLSIGDAFRYSGFQAVSIMTTTGFSTIDFNVWPAFAKATLLILMIVGASAGSTGGALKVTRFLVLMKYTYRRILLAFNPRAILPLKVGGNVLSEKIISGIIGITILYFAILIVGFLVMSALGLDHVTALSSIFATLGNVGPGLGLVGPGANYLFIPPLGKVVLIVCMLAGRLELLTILTLFAPSFWKWR